MKILSFALSTVAYGDTLIGVGLTDQLRAAGADCHYVISRTAEALVRHHGYSYTVMEPGETRDVRAVVDAVVRETRPDTIVLADYLNYWGTLVRRFDVDPWFIDVYQKPVLPIDIWEWEDTSFRFDVLGREYEREVSRRILAMPAQLRPVPVCHLGSGTTGRGFPYRLLTPERRLTAAERTRVRSELGLGPQDRLMMIPVSSWQQPGPDDPGTTEMIRRVAQRVPGLLAGYLGRLPATTHFLFVGYVPPAFRALPAEQVHVLPLCPPERYHALMVSADAVLSLTANGTTMLRAMLMDVPAVLLTNRFHVPDASAVAAVDSELGGLSARTREWLTGTVPIQPFRMWPKGLYTFMSALLKDNAYLEAIAQYELLDEEAVVRGIEGVLYEPATRDALAAGRARYLASVDALPPTPEVFTAAARRAGLSGATL
ncbi:DUF6365 family protein [Micromonospora sp. B11E3]|uniref:DUF6365 family protein n=1 Tax=Micromonospora sp. B11E3 TaxID=3153562 RepID=UPI00325DA8BE